MRGPRLIIAAPLATRIRKARHAKAREGGGDSHHKVHMTAGSGGLHKVLVNPSYFALILKNRFEIGQGRLT